jgi:hypothetical protein
MAGSPRIPRNAKAEILGMLGFRAQTLEIKKAHFGSDTDWLVFEAIGNPRNATQSRRSIPEMHGHVSRIASIWLDFDDVTPNIRRHWECAQSVGP